MMENFPHSSSFVCVCRCVGSHVCVCAVSNKGAVVALQGARVCDSHSQTTGGGEDGCSELEILSPGTDM